MRLLIFIMVLSLLLLGRASHGTGDSGAADIIATTNNKASMITDETTVRVIDVTPKDWRDYVTAGATIALAFFTIVLAAATIYYAVQTSRHVSVSNQLLASNRELISLNEAQNNIVKAQLLSKVDELISSRRIGEGFIIEHDLAPSIRAYLNVAAVDLLGEGYKRKVRVKLRDDHSGSKPLFGISCRPGQIKTIPLIIWERFEAVTHGEDSDFEFIEYVDSE